MTEFIFERIRHYGRVIHGLRDDVIEAVLQSAYDQPLDLVELVLKMQALQAVTTKPEFDPLIVGFKRAHRLVEKEQWDRGKVDVSAFVDPAETELHRQHDMCRSEADRYMREKGYEQALNALVRIKPSIDAFFAAVMVNAEDKGLRNNRLSLLKEVDDLFMSFADFSRIVVQGSEGK
jgi:glycyl-tRNA synthetase beta chain